MDIFGSTDNLIPYANDYLIMIPTMLMIVLGGFGFVVIYNIVSNMIHGRLKPRYLAIHSRVVIRYTIGLLLLGFILFFFTMGGLNNEITWTEALFLSVTARTAGFYSIDMSRLLSSPPAYFLLLVLMFIGAAPLSTGGGIKITTFAVIIHSIFAKARGRETRISKYHIDDQDKKKAFLVFNAALFAMIASFLLVSVSEYISGSSLSFQALLLEVVSAIGTVGLSLGITSKLCLASKLFIIATMIIGRLGTLTFASIIHTRWLKTNEDSSIYPKCDIYLG